MTAREIRRVRRPRRALGFGWFMLCAPSETKMGAVSVQPQPLKKVGWREVTIRWTFAFGERDSKIPTWVQDRCAWHHTRGERGDEHTIGSQGVVVDAAASRARLRTHGATRPYPLVGSTWPACKTDRPPCYE